MREESTGFAWDSDRRDSLTVRFRLLTFVILIAFLFNGCAGPGGWRGGYARQADDLRTPLRYPRALDAREFSLARAAWSYFRTESNAETGFPRTLAGVQHCTLDDIAAAIAGTMAARQVGVIGPLDADQHLRRILASLTEIELFAGTVPNEGYHPITLVPQHESGEPGFSRAPARGVGNLLTALAYVRQAYPPLMDEVDAVILRWSFCDMLTEEGAIHSGEITPAGQLRWSQDLPPGDRQLAAAAFALWGFDVAAAARPPDGTDGYVEGQALPLNPSALRGYPAGTVTTMPWVSMYVWYGWDRPDRPVSSRDVFTAGPFADIADRIYLAQEARYLRTDIRTARAPHRLQRSPFRVIDGLIATHRPWETVTPAGDPAPQFRLFSTRAALGMWATWETDYTRVLMESLPFVISPEGGLYEGLWEGQPRVSAVRSAETNGFALAAFAAAVHGPLLGPTLRDGPWQRAIASGDSLCRTDRQRTH